MWTFEEKLPDSHNHVTDDFLREQFRQLQGDAFIITDGCHNGTLFDLDYDYKDGAMVHSPKRKGTLQTNRIVLLAASLDNQKGKSIGRGSAYMGNALSLAL